MTTTTKPMSNQTTLKDIVLEILANGPKNIGEINKEVFYTYHTDLESMGIEWTYQHLIASSRKSLVDAGIVNRNKGVYSMAI